MIVHNCEQNTEEWHKARAGIPTASAFSKILSGTGRESASMSEYAMKLGIELYKGSQSSDFQGNRHTRRGHELEAQAADEYALVNGVDLQTVGFVTDEDRQYGASPDRLIGDDGFLEIKCLSDKEHFLILEYYNKKHDIPPKYKPQLQGIMLATERNHGEIIFFHPDMPSLTHAVRLDEIYISKLKSQIKLCLAERDVVADFLRNFGASTAPTTSAPTNKLNIEV